MIEKIPLTYNDLDEQADMIMRMITAIVKSEGKSEYNPPKKRKYYAVWAYDEPTWPVISPERNWWFL